MQTGTVKWFSDQKGYGFIESEGKDYFLHHSQIVCDGYRTIKQGQEVSFTPVTGAKGKCAENVVKL